MNGQLVLIAGLLTLTLSLVLPVVIRPLLIKLGVMDVPNERSSHTQPVLRGLGLSVLASLFIGGGVATYWMWTTGDLDNTLFLLTVGAFSFFAGLLGFSEDLKGVSVPVRSFLLLLIAAGASGIIVYLGSAHGFFMPVAASDGGLAVHPDTFNFGQLPVWVLIIIALYGIFFISGYINVGNFMDGLNGISGLNGLVSGLSFAVTGWLLGIDWLIIAGIVLAVAFAGFLPWNLSKRGAFLGDVGSYLLGGSVAITSFAAFASGVPLLATIGPMVIYFGDVVVTLIKRVRAGFKWDVPHKEHVYQKLQQQGRSHLQASLIVTGFTVISSTLGIASMFVNGALWAVFLVGGLATLMIYLAMPKLTR